MKNNEFLFKLDNEKKDTVLLKLDEIYAAIKTEQTSSNIGLLGGECGKILFLFEYGKVFEKKEVFALINTKLEKIFNEVNSGNFDYSYSEGLAGLGWLFNYLAKNDRNGFDFTDSLELFDEILPNIMLKKFKQNDFDFINGALGIANYLMLRLDSKQVTNALQKSIAILKNNKKGFASWISNEGSETVYNLGLAHGIPSILYYLVKHKQNGLFFDDNLINETIDFLISSMQNIESNNYYFPYFAKTKNHIAHDSRLGWCYGDLSIGLLLLTIAQKNKLPVIEEVALKILDNCTKLTKPEITKVVDAGLCHGFSGIFYMFTKAYRLTGKKQFFDSSCYWLEKTLNFAKPDEKCAGYQAFNGVSNKWIHDFGLLEGISGIGLALIATLSNNSFWDECLMLS